jgi:Sybindin-like family
LLPCLFEVTVGSDDGIETLVSGTMVLKCYQTRTGTKFVITTTTPLGGFSNNANVMINLHNIIDLTLREIYAIYTETVLKDPFYELEMPIRSDLFIRAVDSLVRKRSVDLQQLSSNNTTNPIMSSSGVRRLAGGGGAGANTSATGAKR